MTLVTRRKFLRTGSLLTAGLAAGEWGKASEQHSLRVVAADALSFVCQPYLQNLSPNEVTIMWITNHESCHSWVEYGKDGLLDQQAKDSDRGLFKANVRINRMKLSNLLPSTTYSYRVCSREILTYKAYSMTFGNTIKSLTFTFTTPGWNDDSVSALIFNDMHNNASLYQRMIGLSKMPNYDFVFLNGDIIDTTPNEAQILSSIITPCVGLFASQRPFALVRGNHETRDAFARNFFDYFQMGAENKGYYSFTRGPVFFMALDSGEDKSDTDAAYYGMADFDAYREEQAAWLVEEMQTESYRKALYRVVLMHIPPFESGDWHGTMHCREVFNPIFNQNKVSLVVSGHTHKYGVHLANAEHAYPIVIGGGKGTSTSVNTGNATVIKLKASREVLIIEMVDYNGNIVGLHSIAPESVSSLKENSMATERLVVDQGVLYVEGERTITGAVYNTSGLKVRSLQLTPGVTTVSGLEPNQFYLVRIEDRVFKILL